MSNAAWLSACSMLLLAVPALRAQDAAPSGDDVGKVAATAAPTKAKDDDARSKAFNAQVDQKIAELEADYGKGFFKFFYNDGVMPRPYLVAAESKEGYDPSTLENEYAEIFACLYREFFKSYGDLLGMTEIDEPVVALIFDSKKSYEDLYKKHKRLIEEEPEKYADRLDFMLENPDYIGGYYSPLSGRLYQWRNEDLWHVMFHEGTHQLVDFATRKYGKPFSKTAAWFNEGIADYMGGHKWKTRKDEATDKWVKDFTLGQFIGDRFSSLQRALQGGYAIPMKDLIMMSYFEFKSRQNSQEGNSENQLFTGTVYAQGWALVKFMNEYGDGKYRSQFREFFKAECRGQGGGKKFAELFYLDTDEDWADFDQEFVDWVYSDLRSQRPKK